MSPPTQSQWASRFMNADALMWTPKGNFGDGGRPPRTVPDSEMMQDHPGDRASGSR